MTHTDILSTFTPAQKAALTARSDAAGLRHLALYLGVMVLTTCYIAFQGPLWGLALLPQGILIVFLFTLSHECTHETPFASKRLNSVVGHAIAPLMVLPFVWFRYYHLAHHKHTNDPAHDPELAGGGRPQTYAKWLIYLTGWGYWSGAARVLWTNAFGTITAPYLPVRRHRAMRIEARIILGLYALAAVSLVFSPLVLWLWLVPALIAQPVLRAYLLAEHGLCPPVADMLENTRTTFTNRIIRFVAWNMPYHAEHHSWPQVPFHQLPALHAALAPHLKSTSQGYGAFTRDYVRDLAN